MRNLRAFLISTLLFYTCCSSALGLPNLLLSKRAGEVILVSGCTAIAGGQCGQTCPTGKDGGCFNSHYQVSRSIVIQRIALSKNTNACTRSVQTCTVQVLGVARHIILSVPLRETILSANMSSKWVCTSSGAASGGVTTPEWTLVDCLANAGAVSQPGCITNNPDSGCNGN